MKSAWPTVVFLWVVVCVAGCTLVAFNRGDVELHESDSHDASGGGTNAGRSAHTFDINISPR